MVAPGVVGRRGFCYPANRGGMEGRSGPGPFSPELDSTDSARPVEAPAGAYVGGLADAAPEEGGWAGPPALPAAVARADGAPFVGRTAVLRELQDRWQRQRRTAAGLVVLTGEPGIGKTRLAARFAAGVHAGGGVVLCGRADEENVWPYQAFVEALRHYAVHRPGVVAAAQVPPQAARALAALIPELGDSPAAQPPGHGHEHDRNRHHLFEAVVRLLCHAARPAGLLLVLEDLQWADAPTMLLLRHVLRRGEGSRLLVVATSRDREPGEGGRPADPGRGAGGQPVHLGGGG